MKNIGYWKETKFVRYNNIWRSSRDKKQVNPGSLFIVDILAREYAKAISKHARGHLLDLGCGKVPLYDMYNNYVKKVTCVDWTGSKHEIKHADCLFDLNKPIPIKDNQFDTILTTDVLEHIKSPEQLFAEMSRLLKVGGKLILAVPFIYWIHESPYDYYRFTEYALQEFCQKNKLNILQLSSYGGAPEVVIDVICKMARKRVILANVLHFISNAIANTNIVKRISIETSKNIPLGYMMIAEKNNN